MCYGIWFDKRIGEYLMWLGVIVDDFIGVIDIVSFLVENGMLMV